uniref:Uncharacterized protein n=1 Tax=Rhizophora mucronata TaxID=61149 RepID=A0A2P2PER2_RHIMU
MIQNLQSPCICCMTNESILHPNPDILTSTSVNFV